MSYEIKKIETGASHPEIQINLSDKKYTLIITPRHEIKALRHGELWRNLAGDNLIYCLAQVILDQQEKLDSLAGKTSNTSEITRKATQ